MKKLLIVCLGNICRSPLAQAILESEINSAGLTAEFSVDSVATSDYEIGNPADPRTRKNAFKHGIVVEHLARQITDSDCMEAHLVLVVDNPNFTAVESRFDRLNLNKAKLKLLREFDPEPGDKQIPDPWYGDEQGFETVFQIIERTCKNLVKELQP